MQLTTQYRSPTPQTMASVAPLTTPDTNTPQPQITRPMPSITMQAVHSGVGTEAFGACSLSRWIAAHPLLAVGGLLGIFLVLKKRGQK